MTTSNNLHSHVNRLKISALMLICVGVGFGLQGLLQLMGRPHHEHQATSSGSNAPSSATPSTPSAPLWTCSMHPQVSSSEGGTCPLCGMDLIPQAADQGSQATIPQLRLNARARAQARLKTQRVELRPIMGDRAPLWGEVSVSEDARSVVSAWIAGRVERLRVSSVGATVRRGQALADLYSPEIYSAHQTLLSGLKSKEAGKSVVRSARARLRLLGASAQQIKRMERATSPWRRITIYSDRSGIVTQTFSSRGAYVKAGQVLFELADLDHVWVNLRVSERDLNALSINQTLDITAEARPQLSLKGQIKLIEPLLEDSSHVAYARVELSQKGRAPLERLAPGMTVYATLKSKHEESPLALLIPASAPLFAGRKSLVYVEQSSTDEGSVYEARVVRLGSRVGDEYPVISGLKRGERVVTRGAFTLDSESQIRGLMSLTQLGSDLEPRRDEQGLEKLSEEPSFSQEAHTRLSSTLVGYLDLQERLAESQLQEAKREASAWRDRLNKNLSDESLNSTLKVLSAQQHRDLKLIRRLLLHDLAPLIESQDLEKMRAQFLHLTSDVRLFLERFGNLTTATIREAYCPMAFQNQGGAWFQRDHRVDNVYYGDQMRRCGVIQAVIEPRARLQTSEGAR